MKIDLFTEKQFYTMCDAHLSDPIPLHEADLTKPFIYDREWGVFYCPRGYHINGMATLLAFHRREDCWIATAEAMGKRESIDLSDYYLENIAGTCFKSSIGKTVTAWGRGSLTVMEKRILGEITYISE